MSNVQAENTMSEQKKEMVIKRVFNSPIGTVWSMWTDPQHSRAWWGPRGFTAPVMQIDPRKGGKYLFAMRSPEGQEYWSTGTILEYEPPYKLVMTDSFSDDKGNIVNASFYGMSSDFPEMSTYAVIFEQDGDHTILTLISDDVNQIPDAELRDMKAGWQESLDKLEEHLATVASGMDHRSHDMLKDRDCAFIDESDRPPRCEF
ncbi:MAG: SRPBCC domain-containing protein [Ruminococcaceae bacterium]|nr:SRPBCC domain-containing protein [Oscillospiraceae bacterium]